MNNYLFCIGISDGNIAIIDISRTEPVPLTTFRDHTSSVETILFDRDMKLLISTDQQSIITRMLPFDEL